LFRHYLKLLRDRTRFEEEFADFPEEKDGAIGGVPSSCRGSLQHVDHGGF